MLCENCNQINRRDLLMNDELSSASDLVYTQCLGGVAVSASEFQLSGRGFDSRSGCNLVT